MAFLHPKRLPSVRSILAEFPPLPPKKVEPRREEIRRILEGVDERLLVLVGPCSFFPVEAGVQHARRIWALQQQVKDVMLLVERVYTEKPRTDNGWEGIKHNPSPELNGSGGVNVRQGIRAAREAMHRVAPMIGIAEEILNPDLHEYFNDLLSYGAIGARDATVMRQRRAAGGMEFPMGMKHDQSGKILTGVKGVVVAQTPGNKLILGMKEVEVSGNPHAHLILRGSEDNGPNWMPGKIAEAAGLLEDAKVKNPSLIVDCSHANAIDAELGKRTTDQQILVARNVVKNLFRHPKKNRHTKGIMFESFMIGGNQTAGPNMQMDGLSITDNCPGIEETEEFLLWMADELRKRG